MNDTGNNKTIEEGYTETVETFTGNLSQIIATLKQAVKDAEKLDSGNVSAGKRLRKAAQEVVSDLKVFRRSVQETRNKIASDRKNTRTNAT